MHQSKILPMLHQDLRPENLMLDRSGTVRIIDLASTHVAGLTEGGLNAIALREHATVSGPERDLVLRSLLGIRILLAAVAVAVAVGFGSTDATPFGSFEIGGRTMGEAAELVGAPDSLVDAELLGAGVSLS